MNRNNETNVVDLTKEAKCPQQPLISYPCIASTNMTTTRAHKTNLKAPPGMSSSVETENGVFAPSAATHFSDDRLLTQKNRISISPSHQLKKVS